MMDIMKDMLMNNKNELEKYGHKTKKVKKEKGLKYIEYE